MKALQQPNRKRQLRDVCSDPATAEKIASTARVLRSVTMLFSCNRSVCMLLFMLSMMLPMRCWGRLNWLFQRLHHPIFLPQTRLMEVKQSRHARCYLVMFLAASLDIDLELLCTI
jgi:hypothetical protein